MDIGDAIDQGLTVRFAQDDLDMLTRGGQLSAEIRAVIAADYGPSTPEGIVLRELLTTQAGA
ncbi:hypothetical protein [Roseovarius nitratireducens]|uniref:hypothetical protein n=1 Tax=Roseovarius nitratireducens TaxID=2044597 RepID=UPI00101AE9BB|nr:hypothetical protein [Roseovarius nitratireducens]